jgi:hypothetical protein
LIPAGFDRTCCRLEIRNVAEPRQFESQKFKFVFAIASTQLPQLVSDIAFQFDSVLQSTRSNRVNIFLA